MECANTPNRIICYSTCVYNNSRLWKSKKSSYVATLPSGYQFKIDTNGFDAFVTLIHPKSKYTGPGTEGYLGRDEIMDIPPPTNQTIKCDFDF